MKNYFQDKRSQLFHLQKIRQVLKKTPAQERVHKQVPCPHCQKLLLQAELFQNQYICPECGKLLAMPAYARLHHILDEGSFKETQANLESRDILHFPGYLEKLAFSQKRTGMKEALVTGIGQISGIKVAIGAMDNRFMMGSMGTVVGEKITRLTELALKKKLPLILFITSGGARMQEGMFSLLQMAKTAQAIERFRKRSSQPYLAILTHPTTGGVFASFAVLADYILAEPEALIGFAGPRVIERTIGEKLPPGFQSSEDQLQHGTLDQIVLREDLRDELAWYLKFHG